MRKKELAFEVTPLLAGYEANLGVAAQGNGWEALFLCILDKI